MKKLLLLLAAICCMMAMNAQTTFEVDGIKYSVTGENTVEVIAKTSKYSGDIVIPATVTNPNNSTPYYVTGIGNSAFELCINMSSVTIPESVTSIGNYAFVNCNILTSITIPKNVTSIGIQILGYCESLASITVAAENTVYDSRNNCNAIIETASNKLLFGCMNTVIPNTVTSIGDYAFEDCGVTAITIPELVTSIGNSAFKRCNKMTCIYVLATNPPCLGGDAFWATPTGIPVYVPDVSAYESWSEFSNLRPISDVMQAKENAIGAINAAIEGVTYEDILTFANQTITDINDLIIPAESIEPIVVLALAKINAMKDIYAAIEGVTDEDVLAVANQAKTDISDAVTLESINSIETLALAKIDAMKDIYAAIEGVTDEDILAVANQAKTDISDAVTLESINSIKEQALADLAIPLKYYNSGKDDALGALGTPLTGCPAVKVTKGDKTIILYAPEKVEMIKIPATTNN